MRSVCPFDDGNTIIFPVFLKSELIKFENAFNSEEIKVIERDTMLINLQKGKGRACDLFPYAKPLCYPFCYNRFAGTQLSNQGKDVPLPGLLAQFFCD